MAKLRAKPAKPFIVSISPSKSEGTSTETMRSAIENPKTVSVSASKRFGCPPRQPLLTRASFVVVKAPLK